MSDTETPLLVEAQARAHIYDWRIDEIRTVNAADHEIAALISAGILVVLDPAEAARVRALIPKAPRRGGCGCGK